MNKHKREERLNVEGVICPRCGIGTLSPATVNETLRVGANAVEVTVDANVCSYCDEHWLDLAAQTIIDTAIRRLRDGDTSHLEAIGELYRAS
ncbi:MAG: YgiT-type zinc finger protein [Ktedonobacterales bacterium]